MSSTVRIQCVFNGQEVLALLVPDTVSFVIVMICIPCAGLNTFHADGKTGRSRFANIGQQFNTSLVSFM